MTSEYNIQFVKFYRRTCLKFYDRMFPVFKIMRTDSSFMVEKPMLFVPFTCSIISVEAISSCLGTLFSLIKF